MNPSEFIRKWSIRRLYHFTEKANLPSIKQHGIVSLREIERRGITVERYASNEASRSVDRRYGIDSYVRLCFHEQHPMEYIARQEGRLKQTVFLRISPQVLSFEGVRFADGVAYASDAKIYDNLEEAATELDWEVLFRVTGWKDPEVKRRLKQARKYELLVPDQIASNLITNL